VVELFSHVIWLRLDVYDPFIRHERHKTHFYIKMALNFVDGDGVTKEQCQPVVYVTRSETFSACHRLHRSSFNEYSEISLLSYGDQLVKFCSRLFDLPLCGYVCVSAVHS